MGSDLIEHDVCPASVRAAERPRLLVVIKGGEVGWLAGFGKTGTDDVILGAAMRACHGAHDESGQQVAASMKQCLGAHCPAQTTRQAHLV